jgi:hypothetical protein
MSKGFAIGAAALQVIALFAAYAVIVNVQTFNLINPQMIAGLFIGSMMPPVISALLILGVGKNAFRMVEEIRKRIGFTTLSFITLEEMVKAVIEAPNNRILKEEDLCMYCWTGCV